MFHFTMTSGYMQRIFKCTCALYLLIGRINFKKFQCHRQLWLDCYTVAWHRANKRDSLSSRRNGQDLGVSIKSCVWLPTSKAKLVFYGSKSPCPTSYSSMIVKTIINKLLNSKRATTPKNVNKLPVFGLKFFLSLGAAQVFDTRASQLRTVFSLAWEKWPIGQPHSGFLHNLYRIPYKYESRMSNDFLT